LKANGSARQAQGFQEDLQTLRLIKAFAIRREIPKFAEAQLSTYSHPFRLKRQ
jgi:hypothetical protein